jgi:hypothetical protein
MVHLYAFLSQFVQIGRLNCSGPKAGDITVTHIIHKDQDELGGILISYIIY